MLMRVAVTRMLPDDSVFAAELLQYNPASRICIRIVKRFFIVFPMPQHDPVLKFDQCRRRMTMTGKSNPLPASPLAIHACGFRPVSGLASGLVPCESPSRAMRSGVLIHLCSLTVAGAAPDLSLC